MVQDIFLHLTVSPDTLSTLVTFPNASFEAGALLGSMPHTLAACPFNCYKSIQASDANGIVPVTVSTAVGMFGPEQRYTLDRAVSGELRVSYSLSLPAFDPTVRNPGFAVAMHDFAMTGIGTSFLVLPEGIFRFHLSWDLSAFGKDAFGVVGNTRGDFVRECSTYDLKFLYFACGNFKEYAHDGSKLHILTFSKDTRLFDEFVSIEYRYFNYMERFFHDTEGDYYILLYPTKRTLLTGTALPRHCFLGFGADFIIRDISEVEDVLAHELTHNWCNILENQTEDDGLSSLYAESTAEFYSSMMLHRAGGHELDVTVDSINKKLRDYYSSPFRNDAYRETYDKSWTHAFAQRVPYNRGIIMLIHLDHVIRKNTQGEKCLDDLVLDIAEKNKPYRNITWDGFCKAASALTDGESDEIFRSILEGGLLLPPSDYFGDNYELVESTVKERDEGFDLTVRFEPDSIVHGLVSGSNAELAGVRNGDKIISFISGNENDETAATHCVVQRDGNELAFDYVARGKEVPCWQYQKRGN